MAVLPDGYLEIEFDSRRGKVEKIHEYDILTRQTRVCTMYLGENFYKEDNIDLKQTSKRHIFLTGLQLMPHICSMKKGSFFQRGMSPTKIGPKDFYWDTIQPLSKARVVLYT
jgi:hypothetical protein